jgi:hypothetical protein
MRDRTASRNYSPQGDEFRRAHKRHRDWGLERRYAEKTRRLRAATDPRPMAGTTPLTTAPGPVATALPRDGADRELARPRHQVPASSTQPTGGAVPVRSDAVVRSARPEAAADLARPDAGPVPARLEVAAGSARPEVEADLAGSDGGARSAQPVAAAFSVLPSAEAGPGQSEAGRSSAHLMVTGEADVGLSRSAAAASRCAMLCPVGTGVIPGRFTTRSGFGAAHAGSEREPARRDVERTPVKPGLGTGSGRSGRADADRSAVEVSTASLESRWSVGPPVPARTASRGETLVGPEPRWVRSVQAARSLRLGCAGPSSVPRRGPGPARGRGGRGWPGWGGAQRGRKLGGRGPARTGAGADLVGTGMAVGSRAWRDGDHESPSEQPSRPAAAGTPSGRR